VLRGEVRINLEFWLPGAARVGPAGWDQPPDETEEPPAAIGAEWEDQVRRAALEETAYIYGAMIYGWSFHYDIGEQARGLGEELSLEALGTVEWGDPRLVVTDAQVEGMGYSLWSDYRPSPIQERRLTQWRSGTVRPIQGRGRGPSGEFGDGKGGLAVRTIALEDAARTALRSMLRGSERNRPKSAEGRIALAAFPIYGWTGSRLSVTARFLVELTDLTPFAAY
jgi:hypothetical protein